MPALRIFGRRWYTTSDMLPVPATIFTVVYVIYLAVFGAAIGRLDVWGPCSGAGVHYIVATAGLIAVFGLSALLQGSLIALGLRGTCFETQKRHCVVYILYTQAAVWIGQACFMVYGTVVLYLNSVQPHCWTMHQPRKKKAVVHTMVWSTWGQAIFLLIILYVTYNSYQGQNKSRSWEKRLRVLSCCLRCGDAVSTPMQERGPPLPSIAQWISHLFANVDLSPTDLMEAIILAAAAQSMRRKMRIKRALRPAIARASQVKDTGSSSSDADSDDSGDDAETCDSDGDTMNSTDESLADASHKTRRRNSAFLAGGLETPQAKHKETVALPKDYPEEWRSLANQRYAQTARELQSNQEAQSTSTSDDDTLSHSSSRADSGLQQDAKLAGNDPSGREPGITSVPDCLKPPRGKASSSHPISQAVAADKARKSQERQPAGHDRKNSRDGSSRATVNLGSSLHSVAGSETARLSEEVDALASLRTSLESTAAQSTTSSYIELSEVDNQMLDFFNKEARESANGLLTPKERFGIVSSKGKHKNAAPYTSTNGGHAIGLDSSTKNSSSKAHRSRKHSRGDPSLPSSMAGEFQAGLCEADGGLPPPEGGQGQLDRSFTFDSIPTGISHAGTSVEAEASELRALEDEVEYDDQVVPAGQGAYGDQQPIITPSEEVSQAIGNGLQVAEALEEAVGKREQVDYNTLEEASNWARFATAVYAVMPFEEDRHSRSCLGLKAATTEDSVKKSVVEIAGIRSEDLLYFSHCNVALSHLPYMIALDRDRKTVVVAIRGTMSMADLVTDAVVHPEALAGWLPKATRKAMRKTKNGVKKAYAHSGILSATRAILEDLEANGILHTLLQSEDVRKSMEVCRGNLNGKREGKARLNCEGKQAGGVWPSVGFQAGSAKLADSQGEQEQNEEGDEMASAAQGPHRSHREHGEAAGETLQKHLDTKGWKLVVTGHSLGAGAAALISLKIHDRYPDLKCWAFSPPGGLVSRSLVSWMEEWCTSIVVGKDAVPRMTVDNLSRLMDQMVTSLARVRYHKLRVLFGGWWYKSNRPPPQHLFHKYRNIPDEARGALERYLRSVARKGKAKDMFPPGRVMFLRPIKLLQDRDQARDKRNEGYKQKWDCIWITPQELIGEGILISPKMLAHHSMTNALVDAIGYSSRHHPDNPKPEGQKQQDKKEQQEMTNELDSIRVEGEGGNTLDNTADMLSQAS